MAENFRLIPDYDSVSSSSDEELLPIQSHQNSPFCYKDINSFNGIMRAIFRKEFEQVKTFVEEGYNIRSIDNNGNTALHMAAFCYQEEGPNILEYLLNVDGIELNARNFQGQTPLLLSTKDHLEKPAEMLIEAGADVNAGTLEEVTPLHYAVRFSEKLSRKLILAGAELDHVDYSGDTPLHDAVAFGGLEVVCMLLYYGADTSICNSCNMTPFMLSLGGGLIQVALELFEYVTDFNLATREGMSTLFLAITCRFPRIIDMCERGADLNWISDTEYNIFNLVVLPKPKEFRYLWPRFDCANWRYGSSSIIQLILNDNNLPSHEKFENLCIIFEENGLEKITSVINNSSNDFVIHRIVHILCDMGVPYEVVHSLVACMLVCNTPVSELDLDVVYENYGYCELFKLLLYMDIALNTKGTVNIFPSFIYNTSLDFECEFMRKYKNNVAYFDKHFDVVDYERIFKHFIYPRFKTRVLSQCATKMETDHRWRTFNEFVSATPDVPLLKDLARIESRKFICKKFDITTSCQFYTILQRLDLPVIVKKFIAFELPLYEYNLTQKQLELLHHMRVRREINMLSLTH